MRSTTLHSWRIGLAGGVCLLWFAAAAMGADEAPEAAGPQAAEAQGAPATSGGSPGSEPEPTNLWQMIVAGGPINIAFIGCLGLFSMFASAVALERLVNLTRAKLIPPEFANELRELIRKQDTRLASYRELCDRFKGPFVSIVAAGLSRVGRPLPEIEKALEDTAAREMTALKARIRPLTVAGNVAPLIGLLGTVVGMLEAFRTASQAGLGKAELLAKGIYLALETTVAGLIIAIPAMLFASWFHSKAERYMREMDEQLTDVVPALARLEATPERTAARATQANPLMNR